MSVVDFLYETVEIEIKRNRAEDPDLYKDKLNVRVGGQLFVMLNKSLDAHTQFQYKGGMNPHVTRIHTTILNTDYVIDVKTESSMAPDEIRIGPTRRFLGNGMSRAVNRMKDIEEKERQKRPTKFFGSFLK